MGQRQQKHLKLKCFKNALNHSIGNSTGQLEAGECCDWVLQEPSFPQSKTGLENLSKKIVQQFRKDVCQHLLARNLGILSFTVQNTIKDSENLENFLHVSGMVEKIKGDI